MDDSLIGIPIYIEFLLIGVLMAAVSVIYSLLIRFGPKSIRECLKKHRDDNNK